MGSSEHRDLGMHRQIPRRDFLNGIAVAVTGFAMSDSRFANQAARLKALDPFYPPRLTGLRGNDPASIAAFGPMQQGAYRQFPAADVDTREEYDLVVVGAGISGLAAAHFWRRAL